MQIQSRVSDLAHVIQLAVAPVFLLTGIGPTLGVLMFLVGMVALIGGFITFLQEIRLATASLRIGKH